MTDWGMVKDSLTGLPIRPATADDWENTAIEVASGNVYGSWTDHTPGDDRIVWVDGGPSIEVTLADIEALEQEAAQHGDDAQLVLCLLAQGKELPDRPLPGQGYAIKPEAARERCARVIITHRREVAGQ